MYRKINLLKSGSGLVLLLLLCLGTSQVKACFEVLTRFNSVTCYYDSTNYQHFAVRVRSLRLLANAPGLPITIALHNNSPIMDLLDYIAVVDSGTNTRTPGISQFYPWATASSGWDSLYPIGWKGFLGFTEGTGTVGGTHVELIVRCHFPPGYAYAPMFDDLRPTIMGWGNWNDSLQRPASNRWWQDWPFDTTFFFEPIIVPSSFFTDLDADLIYTGTQNGAEIADLDLFPNPVANHLSLVLRNSNRPIQAVEVMDLHGHCIMKVHPSPCSRMSLDVSALPQGVYFAQVKTGAGTVTRRFVR